MRLSHQTENAHGKCVELERNITLDGGELWTVDPAGLPYVVMVTLRVDQGAIAYWSLPGDVPHVLKAHEERSFTWPATIRAVEPTSLSVSIHGGNSA
jgi:hypothetical protein